MVGGICMYMRVIYYWEREGVCLSECMCMGECVCMNRCECVRVRVRVVCVNYCMCISE